MTQTQPIQQDGESASGNAEPEQVTKVLLAVGDSLYGQGIIDFVSGHHWQPATRFYLLHVLEPLSSSLAVPFTFTQEVIEQMMTDQSVSGKQLLTNMRERLEANVPAAQIEVALVTGHPKEEILNFAQSVGADFVIVGSHGRKGLPRSFWEVYQWPLSRMHLAL